MADGDEVVDLVDELLETEARNEMARQAQEARNQSPDARDLDREDRQRRSRANPPGSPTAAGPVFAVGNKVIHDLLGEGIVRKVTLPEGLLLDAGMNKVLFEWVSIDP
ncbi:hypothetical protein AB1Y20_020346 [Prymnesium parvum]|uniref:Uncharacterized protein n=1 Tax=Prymnesium parvum TaxID=97485 RepID=A0AB34JXW1_PRYPA